MNFVHGIASCCACCLVTAGIICPANAAEPVGIPRVIPPPGIELADTDKLPLQAATDHLGQRLATVPTHPQAERILPLLPDVEIYYKAVRYALDLDEFYRPTDAAAAGQLLQQAEQRLDNLLAGSAPWAVDEGLVVRGYRSRIDESVQPYGLVIPADLDRGKPCPLYVWLHGRGDKATDLGFILDRQANAGTIQPPDGIVLHPFGRFCNAFKFAGETDVFEAIEAVQRHYRIDPYRIVLWGFSMGGAGAWHLAAHHPDRWAAASPGAGFAETALYQNLNVANISAAERTLWNMYDVPSYTRNLFNLPLIAYSGERDKQIQAARVMEQAFSEEGRTLRHLIGPDTEHRYHSETLAELSRQMTEHAADGLNRFPPRVNLQTQTLRYSKVHWVEALALDRHWQDSRIDAELAAPRKIVVQTKNVTELALYPPWPGEGFEGGATIEIDGQTINLPKQSVPRPVVDLDNSSGQWALYSSFFSRSYLRKRRGMTGPIDDIWLDPFLVVLPSGKCGSPAVEAWTQAELDHFRDRWRRLFRGELRTRLDSEVTYDDMLNNHLVLWGDTTANSLTRRIAPLLPFAWNEHQLTVGDKAYPADSHVPAMIYPNPLTTYPARYAVLNSGPTFREGHDHTNSQQTPKLPDWAVIDLSEPPSALRPGRIAAAGFFNETWGYIANEDD
ncbi:MAG: prolyl oligopeptidase family serine peptidase [Pirellulales bacterium]